jgi:hypothetical protein
VSNVIEMPTLTRREPEQDLSHDAREINLPVRIVEDRGRGVFIKKCSVLKHILDHRAQLDKPVKLGLSVRDEGRTCEFWFTVAIPAAPTLEEYEQNMINFLQGRIQVYSPTWAGPLLVNSSRDYIAIAKDVNGSIEIWYTPAEWFSDDMLPIAYRAVPKEWIAFQDIEAFIAPIYDFKDGSGHLDILFGRQVSGCRRPNPENPGGYVTTCAGPGVVIPNIPGSLMDWDNPMQLQEQVNRRLHEISSIVEPAKAKFPKFLGHFTTSERLVATVGIAPADTSCQKPWASVMMQEDRGMVRTGSETGDKADQYVASVDFSAALSRIHPREVEEQKLAPRTVIYPMEAVEFMVVVKAGQQDTLPLDYLHVGSTVAQTCDIRAYRAELTLYNYEEALEVDAMVAKWIQLVQTPALGAHPYILEDGPELPKVPGTHADDGGEVLEGMYAERCTSLRDARISGEIGQSCRAGGQVSGSVAHSGAACIVSKSRLTPST